jgi:CheY-like chemotaxis protein
MMPVMNGWQFLDALDDRGATSIPVVVVTADGADGEAVALKGAAAVLRKPMALDSLISTIARVMPNAA